jgi:L-ascorbate metabolism protein UlaG (beta-lactamase superfamily)
MGVSTEPVRLRSDASVEPLVDSFPAWLDVVAPVPASMNLADVQMPLLEAFLGDPRAGRAEDRSRHAGFDESRRVEIAALLEAVKADRAAMLELAAAVGQAEDMLGRDATGRDLTPLHDRLPSALSGLVELTYDTHGRPSLRFFESLVYASNYYDVRRQSVRVSLDGGVRRPVVAGTPQLPRPGALDLAIPFRSAGLDTLFASRTRPTTISRLREALDLDDGQAAQLRTLLDARLRTAPDRHIGSGGRVRYLGHACLLFQTRDGAVVTDPFVGTGNGHGDRYTFDDLPDRIDLAVITEGRPGHVVLETLLQLRSRLGAVVVPRSSRGSRHDPSIGLCLKALGFPVVEVDDFDEVPFPGGTVTATPFLGGHADLPARARSTYFVRMAEAAFFVGAESSGVDPVLYRRLRRHVGAVDLAFFGTSAGDGSPTRLGGSTPPRFDAEQAAAVVRELGADEAYVYVTDRESGPGPVVATHDEDRYRRKQIDEFLDWCHDRGITAEHLFSRREWCW